MESFNKLQKRNLTIILSVTLLSVSGVATIIPAFPEMSEELNVSRDRIGLLITVFTLPGAVLAPLIGMVADRWGRRNILSLALLLFGIAGTSCFFSRDFETILLLRFFQGLGAVCLGIINLTLIGDLFLEEQKIRAMGYNTSVMSIATALFPAVGGLLATVNWYYPFLVPSLAIILGLVVFFFLRNPEPRDKPHLNRYFRDIFRSVLSREALILFLLNFATFLILFGVIMTYLPIFLRDRFNLESREIGFLLSFLAVSAGITASQLKTISRLFSIKSLIALGFLAFLAGFAVMPFVRNMVLLVVVLMVIGMGQGIGIPSIFNILTGIAPLEHRGAFMSVNSMTIRAGQTLGPVISGVFFGLWGLAWVFWAGALTAVFFLLMLILFLTTLRTS